MEYVSFLDAASLAQTQHSNKLSQQGNNLKHKKRGRGRPPLSATLNTTSMTQPLNPTPNGELESASRSVMNHIAENTAGDFIKQEDKQLADDSQNLEESINDTHDMDTNDPNESITNPTIDVKSECTKAPVSIDLSNPLMGVWEGNFSVITPKGIICFLAILIYLLILFLFFRRRTH